MLLLASVRDDNLARPNGYVYAALVVRERMVYIGQTRGQHGALGRFSQHLAFTPPGTLRTRVEQVLRTDLVDLGVVEFAAVQLGPHRQFHAAARDHREAIEALCQYELIEWSVSTDNKVGFISRVGLNGYVRNPAVRAEASRLVVLLAGWLETTLANAESGLDRH